MINNIGLFGGTHGNELTGIYLINHLRENSIIFKKYPFNIVPLLGNPQAILQRVRYIDHDLNRCFTQQTLHEKSSSYEKTRAREIFGQHQKRPFDFIIDLHTTTANMGTTIVLPKTDILGQKCAFYLQQKIPHLKIIETTNTDEHSSFLSKIGKSGILVEIGPIANNVLTAAVYLETQMVLFKILDFLNEIKKNPDKLQEESPSFPRYKVTQTILYPLSPKNKIIGMAHPDICNKDFIPIKKGAPLFMLFDGTIIRSEHDLFYPIFINEAAYFSDKIAMMKCQIIAPKI